MGVGHGSYRNTTRCYTWTLPTQGIEVLLHTLSLHPAGSKLGSPVRMGPSPLPEASCLSSQRGLVTSSDGPSFLPEISTMGGPLQGIFICTCGCGSLTGKAPELSRAF